MKKKIKKIFFYLRVEVVVFFVCWALVLSGLANEFPWLLPAMMVASWWLAGAKEVFALKMGGLAAILFWITRGLAIPYFPNLLKELGLATPTWAVIMTALGILLPKFIYHFFTPQEEDEEGEE